MKIKHIICLMLCAPTVCVAAGCDQNKSGPVATPTTNSEASPSTNDTEASEGKDLFTMSGPAAPVVALTPTDVELVIKPTEGFKINTRFDWRFEFHPNDGVQLASPTVEGDVIKLQDDKASVPVTVTASFAGEHTLTATGNFSVCNADKCELYRDREVTFKMPATDG